MGFFKDMGRKLAGLPTEAEIRQSVENLKSQIVVLYGLTLSLDREVGTTNTQMSLYDALQFDLMSFALYIADADGSVDRSEIAAMEEFLGIGMSYEQYTEGMKRFGWGDADFGSQLPLSYVVLTDLAKSQTMQGKQFALSLASTYMLLGAIIASADGHADPAEEKRVVSYVERLTDYARKL